MRRNVGSLKKMVDCQQGNTDLSPKNYKEMDSANNRSLADPSDGSLQIRIQLTDWIECMIA